MNACDTSSYESVHCAVINGGLLGGQLLSKLVVENLVPINLSAAINHVLKVSSARALVRVIGRARRRALNVVSDMVL